MDVAAGLLSGAVSAREQMEFQREMSNTAHVREIADLQAAGLNPVLSAGGKGASTPEGASDSLSEIMDALNASIATNAEAIHGLGSALKKTTDYDPANWKGSTFLEDLAAAIFGFKGRAGAKVLETLFGSVVNTMFNEHPDLYEGDSGRHARSLIIPQSLSEDERKEEKEYRSEKNAELYDKIKKKLGIWWYSTNAKNLSRSSIEGGT